MIECKCLSGIEALPYLEDLAGLRCQVFNEFPYLYDGDPEAEKKYLKNYTDRSDVLLVVARHGDDVVGVSTCMAMENADPAFQQPFVKAGIPIANICYFGESVLLPEFRGLGVGHRFFDLREDWALSRGFDTNVFCSVIREQEHPATPKDYRSHDDFWKKRGYIKRAGLICDLDWLEIGRQDCQETTHQLVFWSKTIG